MKKLISILIAMSLLFTVVIAAGAETTTFKLKTTDSISTTIPGRTTYTYNLAVAEAGKLTMNINTKGVYFSSISFTKADGTVVADFVSYKGDLKIDGTPNVFDLAKGNYVLSLNTMSNKAPIGIKTSFKATATAKLTLGVAVKVGASINLAPDVSGAEVADITYSSSNKKVATVSSKGVVKGVAKGTAKITATVAGVKSSVTVIVS
jgi:uncharacterized protein YjdB